MYRVFLIDNDPNHAERLASCLRLRGLAVTVVAGIPESKRSLAQRIPIYEIVILAVSGAPDRSLSVLHSLIEASRKLNTSLEPLFLLVSREKFSPFSRLRVEHMGARYAHG